MGLLSESIMAGAGQAMVRSAEMGFDAQTEARKTERLLELYKKKAQIDKQFETPFSEELRRSFLKQYAKEHAKSMFDTADPDRRKVKDVQHDELGGDVTIVYDDGTVERKSSGITPNERGAMEDEAGQYAEDRVDEMDKFNWFGLAGSDEEDFAEYGGSKREAYEQLKQKQLERLKRQRGESSERGKAPERATQAEPPISPMDIPERGDSTPTLDVERPPVRKPKFDDKVIKKARNDPEAYRDILRKANPAASDAQIEVMVRQRFPEAR